MFPGAHARVEYNEAGEPVGWDYPSEREPEADYCDVCGRYGHDGWDCPWDDEEEAEEE